MNLRPFLIASVLGLLAACASNPQPQIRHADRLPAGQAGQQASDADSGVSGIRKDVLEELGRDGPKPVIRRGSGAPINQAAASAPPPSLTSSGQASFNFEGESLHAVVKAILGDMLELGADSRTEHDAIVGLVNELNIDARFVGPEFQRSTSVRSHPNAAALLEFLKNEPLTGHLVLVKGSRGIKLETVVGAL